MKIMKDVKGMKELTHFFQGFSESSLQKLPSSANPHPGWLAGGRVRFLSVHRALGPGLFEHAYCQCLEYELERHGVRFRRQVPLSLTYDTLRLDGVYRADLIVEDELLVELKSIERLLPIHHAQVVTYLKLAGVQQALLINFNVRRLTDGVKSFLAE